MTRVLLIDDDRKHSELLKEYLKKFGITLDCAGNAEEGLRKLSRTDPDLLLLDIMLPGRDGFDVCREVRKSSRIPIIMLTARGDVIDRVSGLEMGADDYIGKPFEPRELVARIESVLRRSRERQQGLRTVLACEGLQLETETRRVVLDGDEVDLTTMEFELLRVLMESRGRVMPRDRLLERLRGLDAGVYDRAIDMLVSRLRHKLGDDSRAPRFIKTVWQTGYQFVGKSVE